MGSTGYIDWHRLDRTRPWVRKNHGQNTYVFAFWTVDYTTSATDDGVGVIKAADDHPDWFIHGHTADHVLGAYPNPNSMVSPNFTAVFDDMVSARPLLASVLIGTSASVYRSEKGLWWASEADLTRPGRKLLAALNKLYERDGYLVTFIDGMTDENSGPRDSRP